MADPPPALLVPDCSWIDPPFDRAEGEIETWGVEEKLGFQAKRLFWLHGIPPGQWRARHAHRESILATFVVTGRCRFSLDDGRRQQTVALDQDGPGLLIGPWIWHELFDFAPDSTILVVASTLYDESEYMRNYEAFLAEVRAR